jgi:hypothetical protein
MIAASFCNRAQHDVYCTVRVRESVIMMPIVAFQALPSPRLFLMERSLQGRSGQSIILTFFNATLFSHHIIPHSSPRLRLLPQAARIRTESQSRKVKRGGEWREVEGRDQHRQDKGGGKKGANVI